MLDISWLSTLITFKNKSWHLFAIVIVKLYSNTILSI